MTEEQNYFIQILADHINGSTTSPRSSINWSEISQLSHTHQIGGIVYYQCKDFLPESVYSSFEKDYSAEIYYYLNREQDTNKLIDAFKKNDIKAFLIKGLAVSKYYPVPALRTMGDSDIVIHGEDREKADSIMISLCYSREESPIGHEWQYYKHGMEYEIHDNLVYEELVTQDKQERFFNDCWKYVKDGVLDPSFHFLFLVLHLRKHLMNSGVGFRQFMDLALMSKKEPSLNWPWIEENLRKLDLFDFASRCAGFIKQWFGIDIPMATALPDDTFFETATQAIFNNGIFGFENSDNQKNATVNAIRKSNSVSKGTAHKVITYVFPPYKTLSGNKIYSYLHGRPYLLPVAYVHHIIRGFSHFSASKRDMKNNFANSDEIQKRDEYLKKWGL